MCRTEAREELRNQVGNLRFDLNTVIESSSKNKADKKAANQLKKDFLTKVHCLLTWLNYYTEYQQVFSHILRSAGYSILPAGQLWCHIDWLGMLPVLIQPLLQAIAKSRLPCLSIELSR